MKNNTRLFLVVVGLGLSTTIYAQSATENFVKSTECLDESCVKKKEAVTYYDGLGREKLSIVKGAGNSTTGGLATKVTYDGFGRVDKEYLPGTIGNLNYGEPDLSVYGIEDTYAYSQKEYENSPLNRVLKQAAPGGTWKLGNGKEIEFDYQTNGWSDEIIDFKASTSYNSSQKIYNISLSRKPSSEFYGVYGIGTLYKTITTDENNQPIEEFKDKEGKVILKRITIDTGRLDTYYVYDVFGNLTYVIPPMLLDAYYGSNPLPGNWQELMDELGYQYKYDDKNRLVEKKLPGKGWEYMVYDKLDRLAAVKDSQNDWIITKYDKFSRVLYTAFLGDSTKTRSSLQDDYNTAIQYHETRTGTFANNGVTTQYTNTAYPVLTISSNPGEGSTLLSVMYYDSYSGLGAASSALDGQSILTGDDKRLKGLVVASFNNVLGTSTWNKNFTYYDTQYIRPIGSELSNHLGGFTKTASVLDFRGKPLMTTTVHRQDFNLLNPPIEVKEEFTYDHFERLVKQTHQVNNGKVEVIAQNTYNAIGQLSQKKVGNLTNAPYQTVDYTYNIRGWLTEINDVDATPTFDMGGKLFAFHISYDELKYGNRRTETSKSLYNGNISQTFWKTPTQAVRSYDYKYDGLNRLLDATFYKGTGITRKNYYDEKIRYDNNGNIVSLDRNGLKESSTPTLIDQLSYTYQGNTNKLLKVADGSNHNEGFKDGTNTGNDYAYDTNGNLTQDLNKGITEITYNHLNLPTEVIWNSTKKIVYSYDASGVKLRKVVTDGIKVTTTDYLGGFQYVNNKLQFLPTAEGYVNVVTSNATGSRTYNYVYNYTDHLGNVRVSYAWDDTENKLKILEENHYYPFGLKHKGYVPLQQIIVTPIEEVEIGGRSTITAKVGDIGIGIDNSISTGSATYNYKYNGKELQDELGLNWTSMDFRNYDSSLARFMSPDRLSEYSMSWTPYRFAYDNPVFWSDPTGLIEFTYDKHGNTTGFSTSDEAEIEALMNFFNNNENASASDVENYVWNDMDTNENSVFSLGLKEAVVTPNNNSNNALALLGVGLDITESIGGSASSVLKDRYTYGKGFSNKPVIVRTAFGPGINTTASKLEKYSKYGKTAGKISKGLVVADIALSGEIRASHVLTGAMLGVNAIPVAGNVISGIYFGADLITMGVSYYLTGEASGIGDYLDQALDGGVIMEAKDIGVEYEGVY